jgi:CheY-like chemotaxis protein
MNEPVNESVLVVEDDNALRTLFLALLKRQGLRVECVNDGAEALDRLAKRAYDVILLDLMMPVVNGFDVLERLAETRPALLRRTIVTTGASERNLAKLDPDRVFAVLRKPFDINTLISTIRQCVRQTTEPQRRARYGSVTLEVSARKFEAAIPELQRLLTTGAPCERELLLRGELRRVVSRLGGVLDAVAAAESDAGLANRYEELGRAAASLSAVPTAAPRTPREH